MAASASLPQVVGVIDLKGGAPVHAVAGRRADYRPLRTTAGPVTPEEAARRILATGLCDSLYLADLDAIDGGPIQQAAIVAIADQCPIVLDVGPTNESEIPRWVDGQRIRPIIASERWADLTNFRGVADVHPNALFSLDLLHGVLNAVDSRTADIRGVVEGVISSGLRHLIVLDIGAVGTQAGCPTLPLCREIAETHPELVLWSGGGLSLEKNTLDDCVDAGLDYVLVGTEIDRAAGLFT